MFQEAVIQTEAQAPKQGLISEASWFYKPWIDGGMPFVASQLTFYEGICPLWWEWVSSKKSGTA
jgi:hypothetical protein